MNIDNICDVGEITFPEIFANSFVILIFFLH